MLVDGAPKPVDDTVYHHPHFVQVPNAASFGFKVL